MAAVATPLDDVFKECRDMDASLAERLASFAAAVHSRLPSFAAAVDRLVKRLSENGAGDAAPREGDPMPPFLLPDETNRLISLEQMLQTGPVAVTFHRGHWCPYCRININALARANETISPEGGQIVAIVPERQQYAMEFKADGQAAFPILTDLDNGYAMSLNLAVWVGEELRQVHARSVGPRHRQLPGQRKLDPAHTRHVRCRAGRYRTGTFRRSGLSQADGHRGSDCRLAEGDVARARWSWNTLVRKSRPVGAAQHFQHHVGNGRALPSGNAVKEYGALKIKAMHRGTHEGRRVGCASGCK